jgi:hypothetical protein
LRGGVVPGKNGGKTGAYFLLAEPPDFFLQFTEDFVADPVSVEESCRHSVVLALPRISASLA